MKLVYSPSAKSLRDKIIFEYSGISIYFDALEKKIQQSPFAATEEKIVIEGKVVAVYKKSVRTGLFSGNLLPSYLYLKMSYFVNKPKQQIIVIGVYIHNYT